MILEICRFILSDHSPVYLEVQVGAETLSPRVRIISAGFALNASRLGGFAPGFYLDTSGTAQTKAGSLASSTGLAGSAPGAGVGVAGTSASGDGVRGTSSATSGSVYGVHGTTPSTTGSGVFGEATATSGNAWGVQGKSSSTAGLGVIGSNLSTSGSTEGVRGQSTSPTGRGVVGGAFSTTGDARGVYGESQSTDGTGVYGRATPATGSTTGVGGDCFSTLGTGVAGVANATSGDAWGVYGGTLSPTGYGVVAENDSLTIGNMYATGTKFFITEHPTQADKAIRYACLEGGESAVYSRGVAKLAHGEARVTLPDHFPMVASGNLTVNLTPLEDCAGLYVPKEGVSSAGFTVRERDGGSSGASFSYLVMADRRGFEDLSVVTTVTPGQKIIMSPRFTHAEKSALRAALGRAEAAGAMAAADEPARSRLFASLEAGSFEDACRELGGCAMAEEAAGGPVLDLKGAATGSGAPVAITDAASAGAGTSSGRSGSRPHGREDAGAVGTSSPQGAGTTGARDPHVAAVDPSLPADPADDPRHDAGVVSGDARAVAGEEDVRGLEHIRAAEAVDAGDVLVVDPASEGSLKRASAAADRRVVGVAAAPGEGPSSRVPVVLWGTAVCKVDADFGAIAAGDLLTASPTPGYAMRAVDPAPGTILGKALDGLAGGRGTIRILVMLR